MIRENNLKLFSIILLCIFVLSGCRADNSLNGYDEAKKYIVIVTRMNYGYHWGSVKLGAYAAAKEFNVDIGYFAPDDEEDVEGQIKLVNNALDNKDRKVDALVLAASDYEAMVQVTEKAYDSGIPVIIIDSEVNTKKINSYVATDNYKAGKEAGQVLVNVAGKDANVAIVSFVKGTRSAEQREEGLMDVISNYPNIKVVAKEYCLSNTNLAYNITKEIISQYRRVDAVVALNEVASEGAAQAINELGLVGKVKVIAFDNTLQGIDYLESGVIQALVIQNPFSIGYIGVKFAVDALQGKPIPREYSIEPKVIDKDDMYLTENQKLIFPFVN